MFLWLSMKRVHNGSIFTHWIWSKIPSLGAMASFTKLLLHKETKAKLMGLPMMC